MLKRGRSVGDSLKEIKLLYVEDDEAIREALSVMLKRVVGKLYTAEDGSKGVELFREVEPDIVVSDIRMPVMDGIEMVKRIKDIDPKVPVIFTTAFGDSEYLKEAIDMGVQGYLIKPIEKRKLMEKLEFVADAIVNSRRKLSYMKLIHALFDSQKDAVLVVDADGNIQMSNLAYKNLCLKFDCETTEHLSGLLTSVESRGSNLSGGKEGEFDIGSIVNMHGEVFEVGSNGESCYFEVHSKRIDDLFLIELHDVTAFMREAKQLERENLIDPLTGAFNRKIFDQACKRVVEAGSGVCVILIDIDHFKRVNDTYGHGVGDEVLVGVVDEIQKSVRSDDYLIRWGGEEFLLLASAHKHGAFALAQKINKRIGERRFDTVGHVTVSCGVSCGSGEGDCNRLVTEADQALYQAKREGRNRVVYFGDMPS